MSKDTFYLFANWKMYLDVAESVTLAESIKKEVSTLSSNIQMVVFPTVLATREVCEVLSGSTVGVGAQNVHWVERGGYTGEVSATMFKSAGCTHALVGHSERRHVFHESNQEVRKKLESILGLGIVPVVCVGETLKERKDGLTEEVIETQLRSAFSDLTLANGQEIFIAYEPVWAVSTGEACDPEEAEKIAAYIFKLMEELLPQLKPIVLYGGSVRSENVGRYFVGDHISGVLVGGSSTKMTTWMEIVHAVQK